jgi:hypothetical protein
LLVGIGGLLKALELIEGLLSLASQDNIILETSDARIFILAEVDSFEKEIALVRRNDALMDFLTERSAETERIPLAQVKAKLGFEDSAALASSSDY